MFTSHNDIDRPTTQTDRKRKENRRSSWSFFSIHPTPSICSWIWRRLNDDGPSALWILDRQDQRKKADFIFCIIDDHDPRLVFFWNAIWS